MPRLESLPSELLLAVLHHVDACTLAALAGCNHDLSIVSKSAVRARLPRELVAGRCPGMGESLRMLWLHELRQSASRYAVSVSRSPSRTDPSACVGIIDERGALRVIGGMSCAGSQQLHAHSMLGGPWLSASWSSRSLMLVHSDGSVLAFGQGWQKEREVQVWCAHAQGIAGGSVSTVSAHLCLGLQDESLHGTELELPEPAIIALACPRHGWVLGRSGAVYRFRPAWHIPDAATAALPAEALCQPVWQPPCPARRVVVVSALFYHALFVTADGTALSYAVHAPGMDVEHAKLRMQRHGRPRHGCCRTYTMRTHSGPDAGAGAGAGIHMEMRRSSCCPPYACMHTHAQVRRFVGRQARVRAPTGLLGVRVHAPHNRVPCRCARRELRGGRRPLAVPDARGTRAQLRRQRCRPVRSVRDRSLVVLSIPRGPRAHLAPGNSCRQGQAQEV